jgi:hypothetical protein
MNFTDTDIVRTRALLDIEWDTPNLSLARSLPRNILVLNPPEDLHKMEAAIAKQMGVKIGSYVGHRPTTIISRMCRVAKVEYLTNFAVICLETP